MGERESLMPEEKFSAQIKLNIQANSLLNSREARVSDTASSNTRTKCFEHSATIKHAQKARRQSKVSGILIA
jgi:hypothetical protein